MMRRSVRGFTLIELLVVIAIIAILAAIIFPVLSNAKERGRQARCLANLKQLGMAVTYYCDDNGGRFPFVRGAARPGLNWCGSLGVQQWCYPQQGQLFKYVRTVNVYKCPTDSTVAAKQLPAIVGAGLTNRDYPLSYSMNTRFDWTRDTPILMSSVARTREVLMLIHESRDTINDGDFNWWDNANDVPSAVHYSGTTLVYVDTHAVWQSYNQLKKSRNDGVWDVTTMPTPPPRLLP